MTDMKIVPISKATPDDHLDVLDALESAIKYANKHTSISIGLVVVNKDASVMTTWHGAKVFELMGALAVLQGRIQQGLVEVDDE